MTGEVTDRFNEITSLGMALFWQKAIDFFTKFMIHFLAYRVERLLWIVGWVTGPCAAKLIGGRGLLMVV